MSSMPPKTSSGYRASASSPVAVVVVFAHLAAVALITLVLVWLLHFRGGLAFQSVNKNKIFNLHPLLMLVGFVLTLGEAIMAYKIVPAKRKTQKVFHLVLHLIALLAGALGVYAVFKFHNESAILNMYSLHSWLGIVTITLFGFQWLLSFFSFAYPGAKSSSRATLAPLHVVMGMTIFFMAILTAETGLVEKFVFLRLQKGREALIMNFTGVLIFLYALFVALTVVLPRIT